MMMKTRYALLGLALLALLYPAIGGAQQAAEEPNVDVAVLNTAAQAWDLSGQNAERFAAVIRQMVALVGVNRGVTLPDNKQTGEMIGKIVMRDVKADPDNLLYAIVDHAVMMSLACQTAQPASFVAPSPADEATPDWTQPEVLTATVQQAWEMSGKSRPEFNKMLNQTMALVMANRGLTVADTKEDGMRLGQILRGDIESHPNDLLYTVVDRSMRQMMAEKPAAPAQ